MTIRIPVNDLARYSGAIAPRLSAVARRVIARGAFVLGPEVESFEREFAGWCGVPHCAGVGNGTDALELALRSVGVGRGDRVVVAANAGMYGTTAVLAIGADPLFVDVSASTGLIEVDAVSNAIASCTGAPKAVVATHLYGQAADASGIASLCRPHGIALVEDCAQAHGALLANGAPVGSAGDAGCFSFYPTKNLGAIGDGGAVVSHSAAIDARVRSLRQYGWSSRYTSTLAGGRNSRLDELQAAFLRELMHDLPARNARRRAIAGAYRAAIVHPAIRLPAMREGDAVHLYVVRSAQRAGLRSHLLDSGIGSDIHYPLPDHRQPSIAAAHAHLDLASTEDWCATCLTLPCHADMTDAEVDEVVVACNGWRAA